MTTVDHGDFTITTEITENGSVETIKFKPETQGANKDSIQLKAAAALQANRDYLALGTPSAAQNAAQVKLLTRECNALIRLMLGLFSEDDA